MLHPRKHPRSALSVPLRNMFAFPAAHRTEASLTALTHVPLTLLCLTSYANCLRWRLDSCSNNGRFEEHAKYLQHVAIGNLWRRSGVSIAETVHHFRDAHALIHPLPDLVRRLIQYM